MTDSAPEGQWSQVAIEKDVAIAVQGCKQNNVGVVGQSNSKYNKKDLTVNAEREDPSEFITHRAKDFLPSIKVIENRFVRASESGREVSRLLEANKIKVGYYEAKGKSSPTILLAAFMFACCDQKGTPVCQEPAQKIINWKRALSSQSSSVRNPLVTTSKEYILIMEATLLKNPA
ncbi:hypothetical protein JHK87_032143 [Glycine soja]|nr:hypothetical protein JHK87_032143 [Glycine soja]